jgi:hypothetical protein
MKGIRHYYPNGNDEKSEHPQRNRKSKTEQKLSQIGTANVKATNAQMIWPHFHFTAIPGPPGDREYLSWPQDKLSCWVLCVSVHVLGSFIINNKQNSF